MWNFVLPALATVGSALISKSGQDSANTQNVALGREQMEFQERMSNTAYQRAVKDMSSAGLNPMLAYSQGGASAPMGSMPQVQNAMAPAMSSAMQAMSTFRELANLEQINAQVKKTQAETKQVESMTFEQSVNAALRAAELRKAQFLGDKAGSDSQIADIMEKALHNQFKADVREDVYSARSAKERASSMLEQLRAGKSEMTFNDDVAIRHLERLIKGSESELMRLAIPQAKSSADFFESLGKEQPIIRMLLEILRGVSGAAGAVSRIR